MTKRTTALTITLRGRDVELRCRGCTYQRVQPLRAAIEASCPKCRRGWRR